MIKNGLALLLAAIVLIPAACSTPAAAPAASATFTPTAEPTAAANAFAVTSNGIVDGVIDPVYGMHGKEIANGVPTLSLPLEFNGAPANAACYAIYMDDPDSVPICGYKWVHWMAVNITLTGLPQGFSAAAGSQAVQGRNDFGTVGYGGPTPPDKDHTYVITVYALDGMLTLKDGFTKDDFAAAIQGHVLAEAKIEGIYKK